jgi:hypothetical protein
MLISSYGYMDENLYLQLGIGFFNRYDLCYWVCGWTIHVKICGGNHILGENMEIN